MPEAGVWDPREKQQWEISWAGAWDPSHWLSTHRCRVQRALTLGTSSASNWATILAWLSVWNSFVRQAPAFYAPGLKGHRVYARTRWGDLFAGTGLYGWHWHWHWHWRTSLERILNSCLYQSGGRQSELMPLSEPCLVHLYILFIIVHKRLSVTLGLYFCHAWCRGGSRYVEGAGDPPTWQ